MVEPNTIDPRSIPFRRLMQRTLFIFPNSVRPELYELHYTRFHFHPTIEPRQLYVSTISQIPSRYKKKGKNKK